MFAAVDTHYSADTSRTGVVIFRAWDDAAAQAEHVDDRQGIAPYEPGAFFKRELPCILSAIKPFRGQLELIVVDGYVWLSAEGRPGMGAMLHDALSGSVAVVGVAKKRFAGSAGVEVFRGGSRRPLIVTAVGLDAQTAAAHVASMHGAHRIPALLKRVDALARGRG